MTAPPLDRTFPIKRPCTLPFLYTMHKKGTLQIAYRHGSRFKIALVERVPATIAQARRSDFSSDSLSHPRTYICSFSDTGTDLEWTKWTGHSQISKIRILLPSIKNVILRAVETTISNANACVNSSDDNEDVSSQLDRCSPLSIPSPNDGRAFSHRRRWELINKMYS